jgi:hypothetical protein
MILVEEQIVEVDFGEGVESSFPAHRALEVEQFEVREIDKPIFKWIASS